MRLLILTLAMIVSAFAASQALATEVPFESAAFSAALTSDRPVAVVFHADWCPTCRAQAPILKQLALDPQHRRLTLFVANFDTDLELRKALHVVKQSTIVVFRKGQEVARSTGDTQRDALAALLSKAGS